MEESGDRRRAGAQGAGRRSVGLSQHPPGVRGRVRRSVARRGAGGGAELPVHRPGRPGRRGDAREGCGGGGRARDARYPTGGHRAGHRVHARTVLVRVAVDRLPRLVPCHGWWHGGRSHALPVQRRSCRDQPLSAARREAAVVGDDAHRRPAGCEPRQPTLREAHHRLLEQEAQRRRVPKPRSLHASWVSSRLPTLFPHRIGGRTGVRTWGRGPG